MENTEGLLLEIDDLLNYHNELRFDKFKTLIDGESKLVVIQRIKNRLITLKQKLKLDGCECNIINIMETYSYKQKIKNKR